MGVPRSQCRRPCRAGHARGTARMLGLVLLATWGPPDGDAPAAAVPLDGDAPAAAVPLDGDAPAAAVPLDGDAPAAAVEHFERRIRPLFHRHCGECHSGSAKVVQGGLRLDRREAVLAGGDSGPVVIPGRPQESLLVASLAHAGDGLDMPPQGRLPQSEIDLVVDWIARGAVMPDDTPDGADSPRAAIDVEEGRDFWAFRPLARPEIPPIADPWIRTPVDAFVLAALRDRGLEPAAEADRATLLRRLSFDLVGLPPTPEELDAFGTNASGTDADTSFDAAVERLLASPHHGERWGRMWLDLARYTDTTESWLGSTAGAWYYRDWVVRAFNDDLPYDQFVRRQLATDALVETAPDDLPALGFLGLAPTYFKELQLPPEIIRVIVADEWEERVDAVGRTFLGLSLACARCHDHKFDPVTQEDYYALAGVFASTRMADRPMIPEDDYRPVAAAKEAVARLAAERKKLEQQKPPPTEALADLDARSAAIKAATPHYDTPLVAAVVDEALDVVLAGDDPQSGTRLAWRPGAQDLPVHVRGNPNRPAAVVPRRFLAVLSTDAPRPLVTGSGRADLADAILTEAAPLAARVIANRVWLGHFGRGLVGTPSNFGRLGEAPSHPDLLEYLASGLVEHGWSLRWLHREIVRSATWRQSSRFDAAAQRIDPDNRLLWRMNRRRLEIEPWRDAMLAVTGELDTTLGGPSLAAEDPANTRRTIYTTVHRREPAKLLVLHDFPDPGLHAERRLETLTPLQGLFTLNSPFMMARGAALAARLEREAPGDDVARVHRAHRLLFGRPARDDELWAAAEFLTAARLEDGETAGAWRSYAHALLGSNEFLFLD